MTPPLHTRLRALGRAEAIQKLKAHPERVGRIALIVGARPVVLPINYLVHDDHIVMRTTDGLIRRHADGGHEVAFQADHLVATWHEGWSVLVNGVLEEVTDPDQRRELLDLPLQPWADGDRDHVLRIHLRDVSGRTLG